MNTAVVHPGIGRLIPSFSKAQKAFIAIVFAGTLALSTVVVAMASLHEHDRWEGVLTAPGTSTNTWADATVQHFHSPYQFLSDAWHQYYDWPPVDMLGAKSRYIYYGTYDSGWYIGSTSAYASVNRGTNYITYADGGYTHKVNGTWTWQYFYSDLLLYP